MSVGHEAAGTGPVAVDPGRRQRCCAVGGRGGRTQGGPVSWASIERKKTGWAQEEQCTFDLLEFFSKRLELIRSKEVLSEFKIF
jgi:hypothetical protein